MGEDLLQACRGSVKSDLMRYEQMILSRPSPEYLAAYEQEANRLRALLDAIDSRPAPSSSERVALTVSLRLKVCLLDGHDPFVFWSHGMATAYVLSKIDAELTANLDEIFKDGQGDYEFTATHFDGQYGFEGRCELAPGWEFEQTGFVSLATKLDELCDGAGGNDA